MNVRKGLYSRWWVDCGAGKKSSEGGRVSVVRIKSYTSIFVNNKLIKILFQLRCGKVPL